MYREGSVLIPTKEGENALVHYQVETFKRRAKTGLGGKKIKFMKITCSDKVLVEYKRGWVINPHEMIGFRIYRELTADYNS